MTDATKIIRDIRLVACIMSYIEIVDKDTTSEIYVDISDVGEDLINKLKENLDVEGYKYNISSTPSSTEVGEEIDRVMHIYFNKEEE